MANYLAPKNLLSQAKATYQRCVRGLKSFTIAVGNMIRRLFGSKVEESHNPVRVAEDIKSVTDRNNNQSICSSNQPSVEKKRITPTRKFRGEVSQLTGRKYSPSGKEVLIPDDNFMQDIYSNLDEDERTEETLVEPKPFGVLFYNEG